MRNHQRQIVIITEVLLFLAFCNGCKKYSENNVWFKNPKKINPFCGRLREYKVNGIDSLSLLNSYFDKTINVVAKWDTKVAYFVTNKLINKESISFNDGDGIGIGGLNFSLTKRNDLMKINYFPGIYDGKIIFNKNLFISSETEWEIIKLPKAGCDLKLRTTLGNGNKYEISMGY